MIWITNEKDYLASYTTEKLLRGWERRKITHGPPKGTEFGSVEKLQSMGFVGLYDEFPPVAASKKDHTDAR